MRSNVITEYLKWFTKQVRMIQQQTQLNYFYRIAGKELCSTTGEEKLLVQVTGKNVLLKLSPQELVRDEATLKGFSPIDVRTITYLACQTELFITPKEKKSFYKIVSQFFSKKRNEEIFTIKEEKLDVEFTKSAQEISSDPKLIEKFNSIDAHRIGYVTGIEQMVVEKCFFQNNQNMSNSSDNESLKHTNHKDEIDSKIINLDSRKTSKNKL